MKALSFIMLFCLFCIHLIGQPVKRAKLLLITGVGITGPQHMYHDWSHAHYNDILVGYVKDFADVRVTTDLAILNDDSLKKYDIILNNSLFMEPTKKQFETFYRFIESGKAYFSIHAGLVSFLNSENYLTMMGGRFINHDDAKTFLVNACDYWYGWETESKKKKHPIVKNVADFKTLDELYLAQFNTSDIEVIARAEFHPIMWTRKWQKGQILCLTLGHGEYSQRNEGFRQLFVNGIKWLLQMQRV
jgi:type 1 glutamine amidotransferase